MKKVLFILTIVQNTLIGRSKQSIGNATFTTWKGKNVLKSKPITVEDPETDGQVTQRLRMKGIVEVFRNISAAIQVGFKERAVGKSEYNAFVSANIMTATDVTLPSTVDILWANLITALGTIFPTGIGTTVADVSDGTITVSFSALASAPGQSLTDVATIVAYNVNSDHYDVGVGVAPRSAGTASITLNDATAGDVLHVYTFFSKADFSKSSDSVYSTTIVVA